MCQLDRWTIIILVSWQLLLKKTDKNCVGSISRELIYHSEEFRRRRFCGRSSRISILSDSRIIFLQNQTLNPKIKVSWKTVSGVVGLHSAFRILHAPDRSPFGTRHALDRQSFLAHIGGPLSNMSSSDLNVDPKWPHTYEAAVPIGSDDSVVQTRSVHPSHRIVRRKSRVILDKTKSARSLHTKDCIFSQSTNQITYPFDLVQPHHHPFQIATFSKKFGDLLFCRVKTQVANIKRWCRMKKTVLFPTGSLNTNFCLHKFNVTWV